VTHARSNAAHPDFDSDTQRPPLNEPSIFTNVSTPRPAVPRPRPGRYVTADKMLMTSVVLPAPDFGFPTWVFPVALVGFLIVLAGAILGHRTITKTGQSNPGTPAIFIILIGFAFPVLSMVVGVTSSLTSQTNYENATRDAIQKQTGVDFQTSQDSRNLDFYYFDQDSYTGLPATLNGDDTVCKIDVNKQTGTHVSITVSCAKPLTYTPIHTK
jgi:hypothetical protein